MHARVCVHALVGVCFVPHTTIKRAQDRNQVRTAPPQHLGNPEVLLVTILGSFGRHLHDCLDHYSRHAIVLFLEPRQHLQLKLPPDRDTEESRERGEREQT